MFDLDTAIATWRHILGQRRSLLPEDLDELESHLRDEVVAFRREGCTPEAAFHQALRAMGTSFAAEKEYRKVYWGKVRRRHVLLRELIGMWSMLTNYLLVILRTFRRNTLLSALNTIGLTVGLASFLVLLLYVAFERGYEASFDKADRIYRVRVDARYADRPPARFAVAYPATGPAMARDFPEVESYVRLARLFAGGHVLTAHPRDGRAVKLRVDHLYYADSTFFRLFSVPMLQGDPETALAAPGTAILSASYARRFFGDADPIGQELTLDGDRSFQVTGVFEDLPTRTHLAVDLLFSYATMREWGDWTESSWGWWDFYTYVLLRPDADPAALQARFPAFVERYKGDAMRRSGYQAVLSLQPIRDIHLTSDLSYEMKANGSATVVAFLTAIAVLILSTAWINYVNLSTARALDRAREVGMRKTLGAPRRQLVFQFLFESTVHTVLAMGLAFLLAALSLPWIRTLTDKPLTFDLLPPPAWLGLGLGILLSGLIGGAYPAAVLSAYRPISVLKGRLSGTSAGLRARKVLITFQIGVTVFLLGTTLSVYRQLQYMQSRDLGFVAEQTLVLDAPTDTDETYADDLVRFKQAVLADPGIEGIGATTAVPGHKINSSSNFRLTDAPTDAQTSLRRLWMDEDAAGVLGLRLLAGRGFDSRLASDSNAVLLNASAVHLLGLPDPSKAIGREVVNEDDRFRIVGVLADYHHQPLRFSPDPLIVFFHRSPQRYFVLRLPRAGISRAELPATLAHVQRAWEASFGDNLFSYVFLDDHFAAQYRAERQLGRVSTLFAALAVLVTALGLFGLSSYTAMQRRREIGIRKTLGAPTRTLLVLLSREYVRLSLVGSLLALPPTWLVVRRWLAGFAYAMDPGWLEWLVPVLAVSLVTLGTIAMQTIRTARLRPADVLRHE